MVKKDFTETMTFELIDDIRTDPRLWISENRQGSVHSTAGTQGLHLSQVEMVLSGTHLGERVRSGAQREGQGSVEKESRLGEKPSLGCRLSSCATFPGGVQGSYTW